MRTFQYVILMLLLTSKAYAYDVQFSWLKNPPGIDGYILHFREGVSYKTPFNDAGLNNDEPKFISTVVAHNPDITVFDNIEPERGYMQISGVSPQHSYSFALTAYREGICSEPTEEHPDVGNQVIREDGTKYCESGYSKVLFLPVQPVPFIKTLRFDG